MYFGIPKGGGVKERDTEVQEMERMLGVWGDAWMNRFVVYSLLEAGLVGLLPELASREGPDGDDDSSGDVVSVSAA